MAKIKAKARWVRPYRVKIKIYGMVHGVGFRFSVQEQCSRFGVSCEPENMSDGTVEVIAEGEESDVSSVTEWCKSGPSFAKVEKVEVSHVT